MPIKTTISLLLIRTNKRGGLADKGFFKETVELIHKKLDI